VQNQNLHVWISRRRHAARLFQTTPYVLSPLNRLWPTRFSSADGQPNYIKVARGTWS